MQYNRTSEYIVYIDYLTSSAEQGASDGSSLQESLANIISNNVIMQPNDDISDEFYLDMLGVSS